MSYTPTSRKVGFTFIWKIENFLLNTCGWSEAIISPPFSIEFFPGVQWSIRVHPATYPQYISCYLRRLSDSGPAIVTAGFEISLATVDDTSASFSVNKFNFKKAQSYGQEKLWKWRTLLENKRFHFPDDSFTVRCYIWTSFTEKLTLNECFALTHIEAEKINFEKSIYNFSAMMSGHKVKFTVPLNINFQVIIYIHKLSADEITLIIKKCADYATGVLLVCRMAFLDEDGIEKDFKESKHFFKGFEEYWKFLPNFKMQKLSDGNLLSNDTLNLKFEFSLSSGNYMSKILETKYVPSRIRNKDITNFDECLSRDLGALLLESKFCDIKLKSGSETLSAHKSILGARSPVFAAMFEADMSEKQSGIVNIPDIDALTLNQLLKFMYTGKIELDEEMARNLFAAADKYQILSLKSICVVYLKQNLTVENVCQMLELADMYQAESLKISSEAFIRSRQNEILYSDEWFSFKKQNSSLACDTLQNIFKYNF